MSINMKMKAIAVTTSTVLIGLSSAVCDGYVVFSNSGTIDQENTVPVNYCIAWSNGLSDVNSLAYKVTCDGSTPQITEYSDLDCQTQTVAATNFAIGELDDSLTQCSSVTDCEYISIKNWMVADATTRCWTFDGSTAIAGSVSNLFYFGGINVTAGGIMNTCMDQYYFDAIYYVPTGGCTAVAGDAVSKDQYSSTGGVCSGTPTTSSLMPILQDFAYPMDAGNGAYMCASVDSCTTNIVSGGSGPTASPTIAPITAPTANPTADPVTAAPTTSPINLSTASPTRAYSGSMISVTVSIISVVITVFYGIIG